MQEKDVYESSNAKYQRWQCTNCWTEKSKALGVTGGLPTDE